MDTVKYIITILFTSDKIFSNGCYYMGTALKIMEDSLKSSGVKSVGIFTIHGTECLIQEK